MPTASSLWRRCHVEEIKRYREDNRQIFYWGETWWFDTQKTIQKGRTDGSRKWKIQNWLGFVWVRFNSHAPTALSLSKSVWKKLVLFFGKAFPNGKLTIRFLYKREFKVVSNSFCTISLLNDTINPAALLLPWNTCSCHYRRCLSNLTASNQPTNLVSMRKRTRPCIPCMLFQLRRGKKTDP